MTQKSGFYNKLAQFNANFFEYKGFLMPESFAGYDPKKEYKVAIADSSYLRKFEIIGIDATILIQKCFHQELNRLSNQELTFITLCRNKVEKIDQGNILKICPTHFRWVGNSDNSGNFFEDKILEWNLKVKITPSTDKMNSLVVFGDSSVDLLKKITWTPIHQPSVDQLKKFRLTLARLEIEQGASLVILRTDLEKKIRYEVFCSPKQAENLLDKLMHAGEEFGVIPIGFGDLNNFFKKF